MSDWRLIALDMDGTLLGREGIISEENRKWVQIALDEGIEVTLATGRYIRTVKPYIQELGLRVPVVTNNGSEVWTVDGTLLERHTFDPEDVQFMHQLALEYGTYYWSSVVDNMFKPDTFPASIESYQWLKFGFYSKDIEVIDEIWDRLAAYGRLEMSASHPTNIEVNPLGVTKATGLQRVCAYLGIDPKQVVAIGDGLNDAPMLRWAGLGIAMENAPQSVKEAADRTTEHCLQDGVAKAIENLLKNK